MFEGRFHPIRNGKDQGIVTAEHDDGERRTVKIRREGEVKKFQVHYTDLFPIEATVTE